MSTPGETVRRRTLPALSQAFGLTASGPLADVPVVGVALADHAVGPGHLFAALPGARVHGARFAAAAVAAGAVAVLTDPDGATQVGDPGVPVLVADDPRAILGDVSAWVYGEPAARLRMFAVTGTNGKTTTSYLLEEALAALGARTGLIGTVELKVADERTPARLTTPEAPELHALLARMVDAGVDDVSMEVSSHALALNRVDGLVYDVAGFTNLSADHLDFHGGVEPYYATKASLFTPERARRGVVVVDDEWGRRLAADATVDVVTVATGTSVDADWQVTINHAAGEHTEFSITHRTGRSLSSRIGMPGRFNVTNAALALVMAIEGGASVADLGRALPRGLAGRVPGRMELVAARPRCIVDFAHNADALRLALSTLRHSTRGRLFVVFGATGERDVAKRAVMGRVAVEGADVVVVTDDDPHDEDPAAVRRDVMAGALRALPVAQRSGRTVDLFEVAPRATAIRRAVAFAGPHDTVLVAGRGHESIQEVAGVEHHLDDREEVRAAVAARDEGRADNT